MENPTISPTSVEAQIQYLQAQLTELNKSYHLLLESRTSETGKLKTDIGSNVESKLSDELNKGRDERSNEEPSPYSRVKILKLVKNPETGERTELPDDTRTRIVESKDNSKLAFILKKKMNDHFSREDDGSEIEIISEPLWSLLKEHLGDHPYHVFRGSSVPLYSPYEAIIFEWDKLQKAAVQEKGDEEERQARDDLKTLLDVISSGSSGDPNLDNSSISGQSFLRGPSFMRGDRPQQFLPWELDCWIYDWNGESFQRTAYTLLFEHFDGQKPLNSLPYRPFGHDIDDESLKHKLVDRGKRFRTLCTAKKGNQLFEYSGDAIFGKKGFSGLVQDEGVSKHTTLFEIHLINLTRRQRVENGSYAFGLGDVLAAKASSVRKLIISETNSRVMVDYSSYFQFGPTTAPNGILNPSRHSSNCSCADCRTNDALAEKYRVGFDTTEAQVKEIWDIDQYLLCPPRVLGYVLAQKHWAQLQVDLVQDIPPDDPNSAWHSRLHLSDKNKKDLLHRLGSEALEVDDIIPGKGKGLVILLYGPPGVGKTSTAETIAQATSKPLFSISVADVGTKARHVEANLGRIFTLATSWKAILLIDEADVFLEKRGIGIAASTDRNALVSVFLRVLEYYQGIMFLTTNQIAQFDAAIPSRIHVSIQYDSLKSDQMAKIFSGFLEPLERKNLIDDYRDIQKWLIEDVYDVGFDGRQIRNIVTTALGLARADGSAKLGKHHLKTVFLNARSFKKEFEVQFDRYIRGQEQLIK
ncbi:AAA family [Colletotrichum acutatum]